MAGMKAINGEIKAISTMTMRKATKSVTGALDRPRNESQGLWLRAALNRFSVTLLLNANKRNAAAPPLQTKLN